MNPSHFSLLLDLYIPSKPFYVPPSPLEIEGKRAGNLSQFLHDLELDHSLMSVRRALYGLTMSEPAPVSGIRDDIGKVLSILGRNYRQAKGTLPCTPFSKNRFLRAIFRQCLIALSLYLRPKRHRRHTHRHRSVWQIPPSPVHPRQ